MICIKKHLSERLFNKHHLLFSFFTMLNIILLPRLMTGKAGFEPTVPLARLLSKQVHSTTLSFALKMTRHDDAFVDDTLHAECVSLS